MIPSHRTCLVKFGSPDFIMEPEIFTQLKKYFQAGGNPEQVFVAEKKSGELSLVLPPR